MALRTGGSGTGGWDGNDSRWEIGDWWRYLTSDDKKARSMPPATE